MRCLFEENFFRDRVKNNIVVIKIPLYLYYKITNKKKEKKLDKKVNV